jgi:hypothetical protein
MMSIYQSTRQFDDFFHETSCHKYEKYHFDPDINARDIFGWLQLRVDCLISSIRNHRKPALQGVIVDLEDELTRRFRWSRDTKDGFFITMIGAMVRYIVEEHGYRVRRNGVRLTNSRIISTAATYDRV